MNRLRVLQQDFQRYVLLPDGCMDTQVASTAKVGAQERLGIYANAYRLRLLEALDTDFPGLHTLVGDEEFDRLGRAYIDTHPSQHFSLRWYGHQVATFLRATLPYAEHPVLAEMAEFEWAMSLAFDADDSALVSVEDMLALPPEAWASMRLLPHASVQRVNLQWNVPVFWKAVQAEQDPEAPEHGSFPMGWVLWRQELNTYFRSLTVDEAWGLDALLSGVSFPDLCQGLCEWVDEEHAPAHAAGMLKRWVQDGMVSGIILPNS
jgi:hypothetical protein